MDVDASVNVDIHRRTPANGLTITSTTRNKPREDSCVCWCRAEKSTISRSAVFSAELKWDFRRLETRVSETTYVFPCVKGVYILSRMRHMFSISLFLGEKKTRLAHKVCDVLEVDLANVHVSAKQL